MENEKTTNHELTLNFQTAEDLNKFLDHINILANIQKMPSFEIGEIVPRCEHGVNINLDICWTFQKKITLATVPDCGDPDCDDRH